LTDSADINQIPGFFQTQESSTTYNRAGAL